MKSDDSSIANPKSGNVELDLRAAVRVQFDISGFRICNAGVVRFQDSLSTVSQVCRYPEGGSIPRLLRRALLSLVLILAIHPSAFATWSILAVDTATGQIVVASATCLPQSVFPRIGAKDLRDIQAVVVPGKGAAVCQAAIETTRRNQQTVFAELGKGTDPVRILELLKSQDSAVESRQFGILDLQGRSIGFSGRGNQATSLSASGKVGASIHYQMQGNILAGDAVIHDAASAFDRAAGMLSDRVMAAMEAADARGGDRRCTDGRTAMVAYLLVVDKSGKETYISATDEDSKNPITALRARYEKAVPGLR